MKRNYFSVTTTLLVFCSLAAAPVCRAQNQPVLSQSQPSGTPTAVTLPPAITIAPSGQLNYVRSFVPKLPIDNPSNLTTATSSWDAKISTVYKDGFDRDMQAVQHQFTPGRNLVAPIDTRFRPDQLSFLPYSTASTGFRAGAFTEQQAYYNSIDPVEGNFAVSRIVNLSTGSQRRMGNYSPGKSQVGMGRATTLTQSTNTANEVALWSLDAGELPVRNGSYPAGQLSVEITNAPNEDVSGTAQPLPPQVRTYKDKEGRLLLQQVSDSSYSTNGGVSFIYSYISTYYVYDDIGRLRYILSPKAVALTGAGNTLSQTVLNELCFQYRYDDRGRRIEQKVPGKGKEYYVYDKADRMVFYQDSTLRYDKKWAFILYDAQSRTLCTGIYNSQESRQTLQDYFYDANSYPLSSVIHYQKDYNLYNYYPSDAPGTLTGCELLSYTYYDDYGIADPNGMLWGSYNDTLQFGEIMGIPGSQVPQRSNRPSGVITGTKVKILPSPGADPSKLGDWRTSANYYDDKGRMIYTVSRDLYQGNVIHASYTGNQYRFGGELLVSKHVQANYKCVDGNPKQTELIKNEYEDGGTGRLRTTYHKVNNSAWIKQSSYVYDDLGRVKRKSLGNNGEVQDYSYNIRSQLTGINGKYAESGNKEGLSRTFGQSLKYDYGFQKLRYDGKIAGIIWRGSNGVTGPNLTARMHAYGYDYDLSGRLKNADYNLQTAFDGGVVGWSKQALDYTVSNLYYDKNGNIRSMNQRCVKPGGGPVNMDVLAYTYKNSDQSNQLDAVSDAATNYNLGDFKDGHTGSGDYTYDGNGNLNTDANKGISQVTYNYFNKPVSILFNNGTKIEYSYDATGGKLQELVTGASAPIKKTDYQGNFIYQNDSLLYALTPDGRTVFNNTTNPAVKEEYFVKDHLGNVRTTIDVYTYPIQQYLATYEIASANLEGMLFEKVAEIRDNKPASTDPGDTQAGRLNGGEADRRVGTSLLVKVMAGDRVDMNVNHFYDGYDDRQDQQVSMEDMLANLISTLTGGTGGLGNSESHDVKMVDRLFTSENYAALENIINQQNTDPTRPKAYLNYVLFDEQMKIVPEMSGAYQVSDPGTWTAIGSQGARLIPTNGYLAVYLTNRSNLVATCLPCSNVFFDKLNVEVSKGNLLEENHYYPHGLPIVGLGSTANGFKDNRRKYQGNEYVKDLNLNWMDFHARQYDPQIGRFNAIDPKADDEQERFSPFAAMGNAPESIVDPNGEKIVLGGNVDNAMTDLRAVLPPEAQGALSQDKGTISFNMEQVDAKYQNDPGVLAMQRMVNGTDKVLYFASSEEASYKFQTIDKETGESVGGPRDLTTDKVTGDPLNGIMSLSYTPRGPKEDGTYDKSGIVPSGKHGALGELTISPTQKWYEPVAKGDYKYGQKYTGETKDKSRTAVVFHEFLEIIARMLDGAAYKDAHNGSSKIELNLPDNDPRKSTWPGVGMIQPLRH